MGCFEHDVDATFHSAQVVSYDETSIIVETGFSAPLDWFIKCGNLLKHDPVQYRATKDDEEPATKRRRLSRPSKKTTFGTDDGSRTSNPEVNICLGKVSITAEMQGRLEHNLQQAELQVDLRRVHSNLAGSVQLSLALPTHHGEVLKLEISKPANDVLAGLALCRAPDLDNSGAAKYLCTLAYETHQNGTAITIRCSVNWQDGRSAFPAGAPGRKFAVYHDYELYSSIFPDSLRQTVDHSQPWTPQDFYESVHTPQKTDGFQLHDSIDAELFPFQQRAVCWMLSREGHVAAPKPASFELVEACQGLQQETVYCNSLQAIISQSKRDTTDLPLGGILAEEMGLGKTVEVMSLIALHPRSVPLPLSAVDLRSSTNVRPSKATLIITPNSILNQWKTELSRHAPKLKVYHYLGIKTTKGKKESADILDKLANDYDVVLTTYSVLASEIHFAEDPPARDMRHGRKYERERSPLVQMQWWRICLDEAQMVESGVTAAARVARRLPRVNSWAVSGTPVKKKVEDLYGLLLFLGVEPFASNATLWHHMIINHRHIFRRLFGVLALRHSKAQVRDDIQLPAQRRIVMTLPFTAVESQHYSSLFEEMCKAVGVQPDGAPGSGHWDPYDTKTVERMRSWLTRLRQTCLHPQVGGKNRRRLGRGQGPLRTVDEVLDVMIEQNDTAIKSEEKGLIGALVQRAHIIGNVREDQERSKKAFELYKEAQKKCEDIVSSARDRLAAAVVSSDSTDADTDVDDSSSEAAPLLGRLRSSLRNALELYHKCVYFVATAIYQIKVNENITAPDSDAFRELERQETETYEHAKQIRKEVLKDASVKAERLIRKIRALQDNISSLRLSPIKDLKMSGGIEARRIVSNSYEVFDLINGMIPYISAWKAKIIEILTKPLVDEDDDKKDITGDEYEESTKQQDELYVYFDALKTLQADLQRAVTGDTAPLIDVEAKSLVRLAKRWFDPEVPLEMKEQPHAPQLCLDLFAIRTEFRKKLEEAGSIRSLIADARQLTDVALTARGALEAEIAEQLLQRLQPILSSYTKALAVLQKDVELLGDTQNLRLEFYRQLQELSDAVVPYKEELDDTLDTRMLQKAMDDEETCSTWLAQLRTKQRFLQHLKQESGKEDTARICVICQCSFESGVLTVCGHQYCKECIRHWWAEHRTCPVCKRKLALVDFHNITYKPKETKVQEEKADLATVDAEISPSREATIYSAVDGRLMDEIKMHDLPSSYGTKIDTLSRHLYWIREHDPGAKSIVFSQYREFLDVLSTAFTEFKIGHARLGKPDAVERFRKDPSIDCLLLDAKTDSSGLTLVNATHVFICEPLVQTAVELQAIARVHRIGQTRPTTVWMYLINDTVEESIYEISVNRRMEHVRARQVSGRVFDRSRSTTPAPFGEQAIDAANSQELQAPLANLLNTGKGGGELVDDGDLWQCLFGHAQKVAANVDTGIVQSEFDRNIRAHAAEGRARMAASSEVV